MSPNEKINLKQRFQLALKRHEVIPEEGTSTL